MSSDAHERQALSRLAWFVVWLIVRAYAATRPKVTINLDGAPYITRWFLTCTPEAGKTGTPGWYLHHIHREDADRRLHNHPWIRAKSWILRGWYDELRRYLATPRRYHPGHVNILGGQTFHRISAVSRGGVWTLFHSGEKTGKGWGFLP